MNNRIRELADKAAENLHKSNGQTWGYNPKFAEEFAELIIRECAKVFPELSGDLKGTYRDQIYDHFYGVEE